MADGAINWQQVTHVHNILDSVPTRLLGAHLHVGANMQADAHRHRRPRRMSSLLCKAVRSTAELLTSAALVLLANFSS